jgi:hypothetical protein
MNSILSVSRFSFLFYGLLSLNACTFDNEETLFKDLVCPEINEPVTYSGFVKPLLEKRCVSCHSSALASGSVNVENYEKLIAHIENNSFLGAIRHSPGFTPMPKGEAKLSDCDIKKLESWINAGYAEN